eukprot:TRINITY_DN78613_c0_g1_i1.p1 TRINITY_DN78613_c0_g1~~TRINITY_DN78613_c0_g1_i1.p1  ORF type:complete len:629 (-),score=110.07 TRINITY_DN78613_c0_g1_i1:7-1806(-)
MATMEMDSSMDCTSPFAAFLSVRKPKEPISPGSRRLAIELDPEDAPHVDRFDVDASKSALSIDLEENPFASYLSLRPAKVEQQAVVEKSEPTIEQHLREEVLKTKRELLQVALQMELNASDPEAPEETVLRLRRLKKAQRYLYQPDRTLDAFSGSEDEDDLATKVAFREPRDKKQRDMGGFDNTWGSTLSGKSRRWSVASVHRLMPPDLHPSMGLLRSTGGSWTSQRPSTGGARSTGGFKDPMLITVDSLAVSSSRAKDETTLFASTGGLHKGQTAVSGSRCSSRGMSRKQMSTMSAPDLSKPGFGESAVSLPTIGTAASKRPMGTTWDGDPIVDEESDRRLTGFYSESRFWNMLISKKDLTISRRIPEMPGGAVCLGNGKLPLFSGAHLMSTGYFYAFRIDAVDEVNFPPGKSDNLSFAFGISHLPGKHRLCKKVMYAYEIPGTVLVGYGPKVVDMGEWYEQKTWDPKDLAVNDVVGVLLSPHGDLVVFVNGNQVFRTATSLTEGNKNDMQPRRKVNGPRRVLFPIIDLHGRVSSITMLPSQSLPNITLKARNKVKLTEQNPLGVKGKKAFPVPGRSLPGIGKPYTVNRTHRLPDDEF